STVALQRWQSEDESVPKYYSAICCASQGGYLPGGTPSCGYEKHRRKPKREGSSNLRKTIPCRSNRPPQARQTRNRSHEHSELVEQVAHTGRSPDVAALHLGQAQLAALNHANEFFDGRLSFRHFEDPIRGGAATFRRV